MKAIKNNVLVSLRKEEEVSASGILLATRNKNIVQLANVLSVGSLVEDFGAGDQIYIDVTQIKWLDKETGVIDINHVIGVKE